MCTAENVLEGTKRSILDLVILPMIVMWFEVHVCRLRVSRTGCMLLARYDAFEAVFTWKLSDVAHSLNVVIVSQHPESSCENHGVCGSKELPVSACAQTQLCVGLL